MKILLIRSICFTNTSFCRLGTKGGYSKLLIFCRVNVNRKQHLFYKFSVTYSLQDIISEMLRKNVFGFLAIDYRLRPPSSTKTIDLIFFLSHPRDSLNFHSFSWKSISWTPEIPPKVVGPWLSSMDTTSRAEAGGQLSICTIHLSYVEETPWCVTITCWFLIAWLTIPPIHRGTQLIAFEP